MYYYNLYVPITDHPEPISSFDSMLNSTPATTRYFLKCIESETIPENIQTNRALHRLLQHHSIPELLEGGMERHYQTYRIPKNSGGFRTIHAPSAELKEVMRVLLAQLSRNLIMHDAAHAYIKNRTTVDAIKKHQNTNYTHFLRLDFHDFFGTCTEEFVKTQLQKLPLFAVQPEEDLDRFISFCSLGGSLPQGTPLSPFLTNAIMIPIDAAISKFVHVHKGCYTRYADDILISTTSANACQHMKRGVLEAIANTPLQLNHEKTRITSINGKNFNLGLMLNKERNITVGNKAKELMRAKLSHFALHSATKGEAEELQGLLNYYMQIEPEYFQNLLTRYSTKYNMDILRSLRRRCAGPL